MYFSYHGTAKKLIAEGHLVYFERVENHNGIKPALVLHFDNHAPTPIRKKRWKEYCDILSDAFKGE